MTRVFSKEHRKKLSLAASNRVFTSEERLAMSLKRTGRKLGPCSEETKQKIRSAHLGKRLTTEHKRKIGESLAGRVVASETRAKISAANLGRKHSEATRTKFSLMRKGKPGKKHASDCPCCAKRRGKLHPGAEAVRKANQNRKLPEPIRVERRRSSSRRVALRVRYGITVEEYDRLLNLQGGVCAICKSLCPSGKRLSIDHDHESGAIRGLLCRKCNRGVGLFNDNLKLLQVAKAYLLHGSSLIPSKARLCKSPKGRVKQVDNLMYKYGISIEDFDRLLRDQEGVCSICLGVSSNGKRLSVDHDHTTKVIRGLLCNHCNLGLGHFNLETLVNAIKYLELAKC